MNKRNIIVIGASAGGFEALKILVASMPPDLDAAVFIVWHMSSDLKGVLPHVLNYQKTLFAAHAVDGEPIRFNRIYVAPPGKHMLLENGNIVLSRGPKENRFRPAIDPLFRSAAYQFGSRVIGIILTGALNDGTAGMWTIKNRGGLTIVQDPDEAEARSMPESALMHVEIDHVLKLENIGPLVTTLAGTDAPESTPLMSAAEEQIAYEIRIAKSTIAIQDTAPGIGKLSTYACPECHGVLAEIREGTIIRYRCHTGHAYTAESLLIAISENIEQALWNAYRAMEENIMLLNGMGDHYAAHNEPGHAAAFFFKAREVKSGAQLVKQALNDHEALSVGNITAETVDIETDN